MATATRRQAAKTTKPVAAFVMPDREWHRATEMLRMFVATGALLNARAQSIILISEPGDGKTELIDRFDENGQLAFVSDLTSIGLEKILKRAKNGQVTHLVANEFQKFFMRKAATWSNTLGMLCQAIEEGVKENHNRESPTNLGGAQIGFIAGLTHDTAKDKNKLFRETGFWSRVAAVDWSMPAEELQGIMSAISRGDRSDLEKIQVALPDRRVRVELPQPLSQQFEKYVLVHMRDHTVLRVFQRLRALAMGCAVLDGRDIVHAVDVEKVVAFGSYWSLRG